jgi:hypothetical protein
MWSIGLTISLLWESKQITVLMEKIDLLRAPLSSKPTKLTLASGSRGARRLILLTAGHFR